jgi:hypothetical protein
MSGEIKEVKVADHFAVMMYESLSKEVRVLRKELDWYKGENARLECKIEEMEGEL